MLFLMVPITREKGRDISPMTKAPTPTKMSKGLYFYFILNSEILNLKVKMNLTS